MGVYHTSATGHAYEEVNFTMTMERAQKILQNEPNSELAPEARKFLLAEVRLVFFDVPQVRAGVP